MFIAKNTKQAEIFLHRIVLKHGSHDQKTHGRKGGKGGSGGGDVGQSNVSDGSPARNNEAISTILQNQISRAEYQLSTFDASKPGGGQRYDALSEDDQSIWERASTEISAGRKFLGEAKKAKTDKEYRSKLSRASEKFDNAFQELEGAENGKLLGAGGSLDTALDKIERLLLPPEERGGGDRMSF